LTIPLGKTLDLKFMNLFNIMLNRETYKTINEVKAAFKKFDKNSDGSLSKNELARMMYR
jgi:Ca2+-binding EF-hand superfamily protein